MAKVIIVNEDRCLGCKQCMIECAMAHTQAGDLAEAVASDNPPQSRLYLAPVGEFGMPMQCRHCQDAPCMTVCPTDAIHRFSDDGPVLLDQERCIGCKFCMLACPFGVIDLSRDGRAMVKCDQCISRTRAGQEPACVAGCVTGALQYVELDEYLREKRRRAAEQTVAAGEAAERAQSAKR